MAIIGATELQPVNVVSNYLAGRESRQNQLAQQQEMAMRQQQMAMQQRAAQRAEESAAAESQNALLRRQALATRDPNAMFAAGLTDDAKNYVSLVGNQEENARKRHEFDVGNMAREAGALANDPSALNKATLSAWVQSNVDKGVITPEAAQRFAAMPDDPQQLSQAMMRLSRQGLTAQQQGEMERAAQTAAREERRLGLEGQRVGLDRQRLGLEGRRVAVSEREAMQPPESTAKIDRVVTDESGRTRFFTAQGQEITPTTAAGAPTAIQGKPSATFEKTRAQKAQLEKDLGRAITELTEISKDGGLIDQSTGSGVGRGLDLGAEFIGVETKGDIAIANLQPIADLVLKMVPRFEGPQSDRDTMSYQQAAGQLADPTKTRARRKEAAKTILRLMKERRNQFGYSDMAGGGEGDVFAEADAILKGGQ